MGEWNNGRVRELESGVLVTGVVAEKDNYKDEEGGQGQQCLGRY